MKKSRWSIEEGVMIIVIAILFIAVLILLYPSLKTTQNISSLEIIKIEGCKNCFDLNFILSILSKIENVEIKNEKTLDYNSIEAQKLISKYNIKKIPSLIILSRSIEKLGLDKELFRENKNYAVFEKPVPYLDITTGKINGIVNLKEIYDSTCIECTNLFNTKTQFDSLGVKTAYEKIDYLSEPGKELSKENNLVFLSSLLLSKEIEEYWWIFSNIKDFLIKNNDYYLFKEPAAPYKDILTGKIKGKIRLTYLTNETCGDCFNVTQLKPGLQNMGIYVDSEEFIDVNTISGKSILNRYNITAIPTIILSKEILDYNQPKKVLEQVGTIEYDNSFVLRKLDSLNVKYQIIN